MDPQYSTSAGIIREFYSSETLKLKTPDLRSRLLGDPEKAIAPMIADDDVIDPETGEVYLNSGDSFSATAVDKIMASKLKELTALSPRAIP